MKGDKRFKRSKKEGLCSYFNIPNAYEVETVIPVEWGQMSANFTPHEGYIAVPGNFKEITVQYKQ